MCDSISVQPSYNLSDSLCRYSQKTGRDFKVHSQSDTLDDFQSNSSFMLEVRSSIENAESTCTYRLQLEDDVQLLQEQLQKEMELHTVLEDAVEQNDITLSTLTGLPNTVKELLSTIARLDIVVSKLDEEMASLHLELNKERYERRLMEYHLKHAHSDTVFVFSPEDTQYLTTVVSGTIMQGKRVSIKSNQHGLVANITKEIPVKGLLDHPNRLSEEMVCCMKNIFITMANSSKSSSKPCSLHSSSLSPCGHQLSSSFRSLSDWSAVSSMGRSPQFDVLATGHSCDPYKVREKLSWAEIGSYKLAAEISWMSVGKRQLKYAAGALRRYRSLVEQLAKVNLVNLSYSEKLAFWINIYNALIMHAYLAYGVPQNDLKLFSLMQKAAYTIGGVFFSAVAIEYGILKMKPPAYRPQIALRVALHKHKIAEEQQKFSIDAVEPLVAFALSCGMYSSPAVRVYTPKNVKRELEDAQYDFIRASVGISRKGRLLVPKMLYCFARRFIEDSSLAVWISQYLPPCQAAFVEHCVLQRRQQWIGSRNCGILPFDSHFRYLFLPDSLSP